MGRKSEKISGGFPLKKHANGQWCAWLNGKRRYFGAGSQEEALENYCRRIRGIMDGTEDREKIQAGKLTVAQLVILFLESIQSKVRTNETSARRFHDIRRVLEVLVVVWGGDRLFSAVTQADCLRLRETFADGCKLDRLNTKIKIVNQMIRWAFDADHLDKMPKISKWLEAPTRKALARERDLTPHFFSPVQIWTLIDAAEKTIDWLCRRRGVDRKTHVTESRADDRERQYRILAEAVRNALDMEMIYRILEQTN